MDRHSTPLESSIIDGEGTKTLKVAAGCYERRLEAGSAAQAARWDSGLRRGVDEVKNKVDWV